MSDITANIVVSMPSQLFTMARQFKAVSNGKVYLGLIDTDPVNPANRIPVYIEREDGSHVQVSQPIIINAGGYPVYNGQIAKFVTVQGHSMAVYDSRGVQQFYFPNVLKYDPDQLRSQLADPAIGDALIGVKLPPTGSATGTVARTQHDKNADTINVRDFGAKGDGVTDDSAAFSAALDWMIRQDVGGGDYPSRIYGKKLFIPNGTYEIKSKIVKSLGFMQGITIEGEHELLTMISVNNPDGFIDITATGRAVFVEINRLSILAKWGTASTQPGVGRDDPPNSISDVHDIASGTAIKVTWPTGISTVKAKTFKLRDVIMTGWNRMRGDYFSNGVYLIGGRAPRLESVVVEGKYGMFITGKPDSLYSNGTAYRFVDTYSPYLDDCYCNHYVRGFDLTSASSDPGFSSSEGGIIQNGAFDAMYGLRISLPSYNGEPGFIICNQHFNYSRVAIDMLGKNQVQIMDCLFYCEASVEGVTCRDIYLRGAQKSVITNNIFGKTNVGNRFSITLDKNNTGPMASCVINNNMHWAGASGTYRTYNIGATSVSNITIGDGECYEVSVANLFTLNGTGHPAINPMRFCGDIVPEGNVWAPRGSLYTLRTTGVLYKKGGVVAESTGWTAVA